MRKTCELFGFFDLFTSQICNKKFRIGNNNLKYIYIYFNCFFYYNSYSSSRAIRQEKSYKIKFTFVLKTFGLDHTLLSLIWFDQMIMIRIIKA